jgi:hypothetical protein
VQQQYQCLSKGFYSALVKLEELEFADSASDALETVFKIAKEDFS